MIGQQREISEGDIQLVRKLYNCDQSTNPLKPTEEDPPTDTKPDPTVNPLNPASTSMNPNPQPPTTSGILLQPPGRTLRALHQQTPPCPIFKFHSPYPFPNIWSTSQIVINLQLVLSQAWRHVSFIGVRSFTHVGRSVA